MQGGVDCPEVLHREEEVMDEPLGHGDDTRVHQKHRVHHWHKPEGREPGACSCCAGCCGVRAILTTAPTTTSTAALDEEQAVGLADEGMDEFDVEEVSPGVDGTPPPEIPWAQVPEHGEGEGALRSQLPFPCEGDPARGDAALQIGDDGVGAGQLEVEDDQLEHRDLLAQEVKGSLGVPA